MTNRRLCFLSAILIFLSVCVLLVTSVWAQGGLTDELHLVPGGAVATATPSPTPTFSPSDVTGLQLWLDADDADTLFQASDCTTAASSDGDPVGCWQDKSGNDNHATQATSSKKPTLKLALQNSRDVARLDGTDDLLTFADVFSSLTEGEIFIIIKIDNDPPSQFLSGCWWFGAATANTHFPFADGIIYDAFGTTARKTTVNPVPSLAQWRIYNVTSKAGEWTSRLDGTQLWTTGTNTAGFTATPKLGESYQDLYHLDGEIGEVLLYSPALSSSDRDDVNDYLSSRWDITLAQYLLKDHYLVKAHRLALRPWASGAYNEKMAFVHSGYIAIP